MPGKKRREGPGVVVTENRASIALHHQADYRTGGIVGQDPSYMSRSQPSTYLSLNCPN